MIATWCGCFTFIFIVCLFMPLYLRSLDNEYDAICRVTEREREECTYRRCRSTGTRRSRRTTCTTYDGYKFRYKYLIENGELCTPESIFTERSECSGSKSYDYNIGETRDCYIEKNCDTGDVSFNSADSYRIASWVFLGLGSLTFLWGCCGLINWWAFDKPLEEAQIQNQNDLHV